MIEHDGREDDPFDALIGAMGESPMLWAGPVSDDPWNPTGAVFPQRPTGPNVEAEWEERCLAMHQAQTQIDANAIPTKESDKPFERPMFHRLANEEKAPIPKFEDLPPELRRGMFRGD